MGKGFLVIGTVEEMPENSALDARVADIFTKLRATDELMFVAARYEKSREPETTLYAGIEQKPVIERLEAIGGVRVSEGAIHTEITMTYENPVTVLLPMRKRSLWGTKDYLGRIAKVPSVAVIPVPLLNIGDYEAVTSGMLPDLLENGGQSQLTPFFEKAIRHACLTFLRDFENIREHPNKHSLRGILDQDRKNLKIYFPSSPEFNRQLDYAIKTHDFEAARTLVNDQLYKLL